MNVGLVLRLKGAEHGGGEDQRVVDVKPHDDRPARQEQRELLDSDLACPSGVSGMNCGGGAPAIKRLRRSLALLALVTLLPARRSGAKKSL